MSNTRKRICADEALANFLALGQSRTLPRLRERYCRNAKLIPPALSTLKRWSMADEWQARAREHDLAVQAATSEKAIEREADQRVEVSLKWARNRSPWSLIGHSSPSGSRLARFN